MPGVQRRVGMTMVMAATMSKYTGIYNRFKSVNKTVYRNKILISIRKIHKLKYFEYKYEISQFKTARKAFCGTSTEPICFMRFLPLFCFSNSFFLRVISPP